VALLVIPGISMEHRVFYFHGSRSP